MPLGRTLLLPVAFLVAALFALATAAVAVGSIERRSSQAVRSALTLEGQDWVTVEADGLLVRLSGMAETEALRFRALSVAGGVIDSARVIDAMEVRPVAELRAPEFSLEILRNDDEMSLIGLIPAATDRDALLAGLARLVRGAEVGDMLETADYPEPAGWEAAVDFGLAALERLPRSKISVTADRVAITAITTGGAERTRLESELSRLVPPGLRLTMDLSAPRPVITPFTLRFLIDEDGARFDACSADTEAARTRILAAAVAAGAEGKSTCTIGLGVPSPRWSEAVVAGIGALAQLGSGSLTFSDADISLVAADTVPQADFDLVVGELERALPDAFSLTAVLSERAESGAAQGPPEFTATRSPEGELQMRGRVTDEAVRQVVESYAAARFGAGKVYAATRLDAELPEGWPVRVLAALEALAELSSGSVVVQPDLVRIRGVTGNPEANAEVARLLASKLGEGARFEISVTYEERLDPALGLPTPEQCAAEINAILTARKISFAPGSSSIEGEALRTLDDIAGVLRTCPDVAMEIGAHSDSQGRDEMNLALSQSRADAVLDGLLARRVLTSNLTAVGYGETRPIADNATEEGREANRRIEFSLIVPEEEPAETGGEEQGAPADGAEAQAGAGDDAAQEGAEDGNEQD